MNFKNTIKRVLLNNEGLQTPELLVIAGIIVATAIIIGARIRSGMSSSSDIISNKINSFNNLGSW